MSYTKSSTNDIGMKIFWGGLMLAITALFVFRHDDHIRGSKPLVTWSESTVVNATNSDIPPDLGNLEQGYPKREMDMLRDRIRTLESEVAALRRQVRALDR